MSLEHINSRYLYHFATIPVQQVAEAFKLSWVNVLTLKPWFGHFTLLFGHLRRRNVPKFITHVQCRAGPGALSICMEKQVLLVGQQMEQSFPLEIFRKKRNNFSPLFPFLPKWPEYYWTISLGHTRVPCSLLRYAVYFSKLPVERTVPFDSTTEQLFFPYALFHLAENCHRFFHINGKRSWFSPRIGALCEVKTEVTQVQERENFDPCALMLAFSRWN